MPELPEVETMVRGIRPHVTLKLIRSVSECSNSCKPISLSPSFEHLKSHLIGKSFVDVRRLGKRVVLHLSDGSDLVIEPRMTGLVLLSDPPDLEHLRLKWEFEGADSYRALWFWDRRGLGVIRLFPPGQLRIHYGPDKLGPDALDMKFSDWCARCAKSKREIKVVLLDQQIVAGIGNLYASEILHVAGINPTAPAEVLSKSAIQKLSEAVQTVLLTAIEYEGSTLGDGTYRNALNKNGRYQNLHRVYMKEGKKCTTCGRGLIVRAVQSQRSTFYCPVCQKKPRKRC